MADEIGRTDRKLDMLDYIKNKKIGIWGWGVAGKSVANYMIAHQAKVSVFDSKQLPATEQAFRGTLLEFLETQEYIFPSPGIDLRKYSNYRHKWLSELDLFAHEWHKPSIGITGTIGKTSLTHILTQLLTSTGKAIITGGNIGIGLLDLLRQQETTDCAVLELSSYQLERSTIYAPTIAILTNLYPNHLDRHGTIHDYFEAKYKLFAHQKDTQISIVPLELNSEFRKKTKRAFIFFSDHAPTKAEIQTLLPDDVLYYIQEQKNIICLSKQSHTLDTLLEKIPTLSYPTNWLIAVAVLRALGKNAAGIESLLQSSSILLPEHRGELVAIKNGREYYNDSKSTIFESTLAAVERLNDKPLILLLGGLSKGVDRTKRIPKLLGKVTFVACFGAEAQELFEACVKHGIPASCDASLPAAFESAHKQARTGYRILFSPAGTSFDLFKNYQERGEAFCLLVKNI